MIKANELRLGNWILKDGNKCKVTAIVDKKVWAHSVEIKCFNDGFAFNPIELTAAIIHKFNFRDCPCGGFQNNKMHIGKTEDGQFYYHSIQRTPIKYVHHFQNLYFSLTGDELEIESVP
jgi:hypothetical protein